ncbi:solute carrier family 23 member 1-like [Mizuhopecten yessoensis]|uniref:Solute carrier family 23 member 1 n=1 Tax=Mizuhopecten yessoensis TaxID=6573 RepID=A0A210Q551_MIZYE|nr:solute carrier family 23 member 1-like [Mizuhopecten yessoensis]XP_021366939.1 solute carrier family 23 member 1-like [Mizuhopecten yessoensis]OWF43864.1 Solute carrier family 23 member 1 [Mizuhopecten yessoensis]
MTTKEGAARDNGGSDLLYKVSERPPLHITAILSFQQVLISLAGSLAVSSFVADAACAEDDMDLKSRLLSSTLLMNGVTTLLMVTIGIRLPLYQGAAALYIVPLIAIQSVDQNRCLISEEANSTRHYGMSLSSNSNTVSFEGIENPALKHLAMTRIREMAGSLMVAGIVHFAIGATGLVGLALRVIGPVTIVPTVLLSGLYLTRAVTKFSKTHWGIAFATAAMAIIMSIYLSKKKTPVPAWSKERGFYWTRYPFHQMFAIMIGMLFGWALSGIMTAADVIPFDPKSIHFKARTDARGDVVENANWFYFPYPGQFGSPIFETGAFSAFLIATFISILDSIGDYYACAMICNVPPPPAHGVNRGIAIEGLCTALSGAMGCGHATSTQGGNIGAIGITKVASRSVFLGASIIFILFGLVGKVSAIFVTMPYPVLGGGMLVMYGMFTGVVLSNLQVVSLKSTRNLAIIGISILSGLMIPRWIETTPDAIDTGNLTADKILKVLLANPNLTGGIVSCLLDNTTPATLQERGISAWRPQHSVKQNGDDKNSSFIMEQSSRSEGLEVYDLPFSIRCIPEKLLKYIPFLPRPNNSQEIFPMPQFNV